MTYFSKSLLAVMTLVFASGLVAQRSLAADVVKSDVKYKCVDPNSETDISAQVTVLKISNDLAEGGPVTLRVAANVKRGSADGKPLLETCQPVYQGLHCASTLGQNRVEIYPKVGKDGTLNMVGIVVWSGKGPKGFRLEKCSVEASASDAHGANYL